MGSRFAVGVERLRLTAASVQRQHRLGSRPFVVRCPRHALAQLGEQFAIETLAKIRVDPQGLRVRPRFGEHASRRDDERRVAQIRQRLAPPELERVGQHVAGACVISCRCCEACLLHQTLEAVQVELAFLDPNRVTAGMRQEALCLAVRSQRPPDPGDVHVERVHCRVGRGEPERVGQAVA